MRGLTYPFTVAVRVDEETLSKLDFVHMYEGYSRGEFCRIALQDYLAGVSMKESACMKAYEHWRRARAKDPKLGMQRFIATQKLDTPIR